MKSLRAVTLMLFSILSEQTHAYNKRQLISQAYANRQIMSISIMKCGSHLLSKCIEKITRRIFTHDGPDDRKYVRYTLHNGACFTVTANDFGYLTHLPSNKFWMTHLLPLHEYTEQLIQDKNRRMFFIYRDPRDQVVSFMYYIRAQRKINNFYNSMVDTMTDAELITALIEGAPIYCSDTKDQRHIMTSGVNNYYRAYLPWINIPGVYSMRFEDLIGENGGGATEAQYKVISDICSHLNMSINQNSVIRLAQELFGGTATFREGKIGAWKTHFTEEHKILFKKVAGELLINLGYEVDDNW